MGNHSRPRVGREWPLAGMLGRSLGEAQLSQPFSHTSNPNSWSSRRSDFIQLVICYAVSFIQSANSRSSSFSRFYATLIVTRPKLPGCCECTATPSPARFQSWISTSARSAKPSAVPCVAWILQGRRNSPAEQRRAGGTIEFSLSCGPGRRTIEDSLY